jgi:hypothetical protein
MLIDITATISPRIVLGFYRCSATPVMILVNVKELPPVLFTYKGLSDPVSPHRLMGTFPYYHSHTIELVPF